MTAMIVLLSAASIESDYLAEEVSIARDRRKEGSTLPHILPVDHHFSELKKILDELESHVASIIHAGREHLARAAEAVAKKLGEHPKAEAGKSPEE